MADSTTQETNQLNKQTSGIKDASLAAVESPTVKLDDNLAADQAALEDYAPGTKAEKRLLRKVDMIMIPSLWFMCVMAYLDRNNIVSFVNSCYMEQYLILCKGNANAAGMSTDLNLTDSGMSPLIPQMQQD